MPLYSVNDLAGGNPGENRPTPRTLPEPDESRTMPIPRIGRRKAERRRLLLLGSVGALLVAAPIALIGFFDDQEPIAAPGSVSPPGSSVPAGGGVMNGYSKEPASRVVPDSGWRLTHVARSKAGTVVRTHHSGKIEDTTTGWVDLGGSAGGDPVALTDVQGRMAAFVVSTEGVLTYDPQIDPDAEQPGTWLELGGRDLVGTPAVAQDSLGRMFAFVRSADGTVWETHETTAGTGAWSGLQDTGVPPVQDDPVVHINAQDELTLFALGTDGVLRTRSQHQPGGDTWSPPRAIHGTVGTSPAVAIDFQDRLQLFALDPSGEVRQSTELGPYDRWTDWRGWESWRTGPALFAERPGVAMDAKGSLVVFARDAGGAVHESFQSGPGRTGWKEWKDRGGDVVELTAVARDFSKRLCVYGIGSDGSLTRIRQSGPAAGPWTSWATDLAGDLATG
ncbi:hypothetical protein [Saccharopolyspora gregorii]|uniref:PLL-like beta propeller domain-containing protein n=1 Tax=Saccharopolyspora gregorii TaxID=33914 RepID=A0ABP6S286_9PSEU